MKKLPMNNATATATRTMMTFLLALRTASFSELDTMR